MSKAKSIPAAEADPNRNLDGTFRRGNRASVRSGLYQRLNLSRGERRRSARVRKYLVEGGLPDDVAASLAIGWLNAQRIIEWFTTLEDPEERRKEFGTFERALQLTLHVLARRDRALGQGDDDAPIPLWKQIDEARRALEQEGSAS